MIMNTRNEIIFNLYIVGKSPDALRMVQRLKSLLDTNIKSGYTLNVIDILQNPDVALSDNILASPTLIRVKPLPVKRIVGMVPFKNLIAEFELSGFLQVND